MTWASSMVKVCSSKNIGGVYLFSMSSVHGWYGPESSAIGNISVKMLLVVTWASAMVKVCSSKNVEELLSLTSSAT